MLHAICYRSNINVEGSVYGVSCDPEGNKVAVQLTEGSILHFDTGNFIIQEKISSQKKLNGLQK